MCKATIGYCTELGEDVAQWNRQSPLPPPSWFAAELAVFATAVTAMARGDREAAMTTLETMRSAAMRDWVIVHGMASGARRKRKFGLTAESLPKHDRHAERSPSKYEAAVFSRDAYRCRYCGLKLVDKRVLQAFERSVSSPKFFATLRSGHVRDVDLHGAVHAFKIVADHIVPHRTGGQTTLENLVSACPTCNYGKSWYTVEELGIEDPRSHPPVEDDWDGLVSFPRIPGHRV
jgi:5-methylcytosine-specific restriction endonuclease McrA